ncbi:pyrroline-5-carboxylate reductase [Anaerocolumna cellulosilytica]|uniref:Pyrroline-5-carboxylate reductase n=1 Tax=Anaerocolumna cellulosilytica TaxID=433286 RepID=A0A6S6R7I2_9FIRM|nr:pyrroline-5-carboxylate reductase [Anaerocolumna cellulosilytica]MBB5197109.1 pyrroline-5-carboxylate reductase [Anaerocolumna cellulosilytica]BCJ95322.1 pyrroline-5-carboxylate reductase [Anaerocolumna cellulosilytica]
MDKIGFIGAGNMGYPMLRGVAKVFGSEQVTFTSASKERCESVSARTGLSFLEDNKSIAGTCKYVVLAVKPQFFQAIYEEIKGLITKEHVIISIAAGITIEDIKKGLGSFVRVVRSMPNTPALVDEGMTGVCYSKDTFTEEEKAVLDRFFTSFGKYQIFDESLMNAVICANGSSPAYVYMLIEALADSVVKYGIPRDKAYELVAQSVYGAAKMVMETKEHPGRLKDQVCSPGGTTIEAVAALEEYGFRNAVIKATDACYNKAINMEK